MSTNNQQTQMVADVMFIGTSFDSRSKTGVAYRLLMTGKEFIDFKQSHSSKLNCDNTEFSETTATRLDLLTAIWALEHCQSVSLQPGFVVCTDSSAILNLIVKRERLEQTEYAGARPGTTVMNADIYKEFFVRFDQAACHFINPKDLEDGFLEKEKMVFLMSAVQKKARENLSLQRKEVSTEKFADKWF